MAEPHPRAHWGAILAVGAAALAVIAALFFFTPRSPPPSSTEAASGTAPAGCVLNPGAAIGGPISLIDQSGEPVTQAHFADGMTLVYFGYTYCPDVCPLGLQMEKQALKEVGDEAGVIQPVMISLDPARDTPAVMAEYVKSPAFPAGLIGLTGSKAQIAKAAKAFRIVWKKIDTPGSAAGYTIGHSSYMYLLDDEWRVRALFPTTMSPKDAAQCIRAGVQNVQ